MYCVYSSPPLHRKKTLYACESFDGFVNRTVLKIEKLPWHAVAATVQAFVCRFVEGVYTK